eukprot:564672_1
MTMDFNEGHKRHRKSRMKEYAISRHIPLHPLPQNIGESENSIVGGGVCGALDGGGVGVLTENMCHLRLDIATAIAAVVCGGSVFVYFGDAMKTVLVLFMVFLCILHWKQKRCAILLVFWRLHCVSCDDVKQMGQKFVDEAMTKGGFDAIYSDCVIGSVGGEALIDGVLSGLYCFGWWRERHKWWQQHRVSIVMYLKQQSIMEWPLLLLYQNV